MKRRDLILLASTPIALHAAASVLSSSAVAAPQEDAPPTPIELTNRTFRLTLTPRNGLHCILEHVPSGIRLAESEYSYSFGTPVFSRSHKEATGIVLSGRTENGIDIEHRFTIDAAAGWIEEEIKLTNSTDIPIAMPMRCGFVLPAHNDTLKDYVFTAVPFRREPYGHQKQYADYSLDQILHEGRRSRLRYDPDFPLYDSGWNHTFPDLHKFSRPMVGAPLVGAYAAEGWALTDGKNGFLISKYSQSACEYAVLDRVPLSAGVKGLRWGGIGAAEDDWEYAVTLPPRSQRSFGVSRLTAFTGDLTQGFYTFRQERETRGHRVPEDFDPPLHWNEIYDNKLYYNGEWKNEAYSDGMLARMDAYFDPKNRSELYTLKHMRDEARKARDMGCQALYLDPGWDTPQSSKLWDTKRLGDIEDFVAMLKNEFGGLKLALHTPLSWWHDVKYDRLIPGSARSDATGRETLYPCGASTQYLEETARRLRVLADAGVYFFMFDGVANVNGDCWNRQHGHSVPLKPSEYLDATNRLAKMVHQTHPHVLLEMHARGAMMGPPIAPIYYGHGRDASGISGFDEIWGFELMVNSMSDLLIGNSMALYYYNLAYSLPLYLHIDLRTDNTGCITFWWNASTCRHLGIGGTHENAEVVAAHKKAIATYRRLKHYYTAGVFHGIGELTHFHRARDSQSAVINCFNLENHAVEREIDIVLTDCGLDPSKDYRFLGASFKKARGSYSGKVSIPALGHTLIQVL